MKKKLALLILTSLLPTLALAGTAFFKYDYESGMNRICVYDHLGSEVHITIPLTKICPLTIRV